MLLIYSSYQRKNIIYVKKWLHIYSNKIKLFLLIYVLLSLPLQHWYDPLGCEKLYKIKFVEVIFPRSDIKYAISIYKIVHKYILLLPLYIYKCTYIYVLAYRYIIYRLFLYMSGIYENIILILITQNECDSGNVCRCRIMLLEYSITKQSNICE